MNILFKTLLVVLIFVVASSFLSVAEDIIRAEYFNPEPIHVESVNTEAIEESIGLTIVLRDAGYDGSTYRLQYMPQYRILVGTYTIPGQQPPEVYFTK